MTFKREIGSETLSNQAGGKPRLERGLIIWQKTNEWTESEYLTREMAEDSGDEE